MNQEQKNILKALESIKPFLDISINLKKAHNDLIGRYKEIESAEPTVKPIDKVNVGDIFVCIWGYGQSNVEYYQVARKTKTTVALRVVRGEIVETGEYYDSVMPNVDYYSEESISRKKVFESEGMLHVNISSFKTAMLWNGKAAKQTALGRGH